MFTVTIGGFTTKDEAKAFADWIAAGDLQEASHDILLENNGFMLNTMSEIQEQKNGFYLETSTHYLEEEEGSMYSYLKKEDYYESKSIGTKARSNKVCVHCNTVIPQGEPHQMHHFYPEFDAYATHTRCTDDFIAKLK